MTPEAGDKKPLTYHLYHDEFLVGRVVEDGADFPSIHCRVDLAEMDSAPEWREPLERYMKVSVEQHLETLCRLAALSLKTSAEDVDLDRVGGEWFRELNQLDTEVAMFRIPGDRRRLEQVSAVRTPKTR